VDKTIHKKINGTCSTCRKWDSKAVDIPARGKCYTGQITKAFEVCDHYDGYTKFELIQRILDRRNEVLLGIGEVDGVRGNCLNDKETNIKTLCIIYTDRRVFKPIISVHEGGVTGYEGFYVSKHSVNNMKEKLQENVTEWLACAGIKNSWDTLNLDLWQLLVFIDIVVGNKELPVV
jgi:hypothetical protein